MPRWSSALPVVDRALFTNERDKALSTGPEMGLLSPNGTTGATEAFHRLTLTNFSKAALTIV